MPLELKRGQVLLAGAAVAAGIPIASVVAATCHRVNRLLAGDSLRMALQPVVNVRSGCVVGVEALARFPDGRSPDVWFAEAASAGLAVELGRLAFLAALDLLPTLPRPYYMAVNVSPALLNDPTVVHRLSEPDIRGDALVLELTEHEKVQSYDDLRSTLEPLRRRGVRLAIDDTGAGYASLNHVLELRPDIIKLDRSLVANVSHDSAKHAVLGALVGLGAELGASVTAEGVETALELELLTRLGVDSVQGYLLARPTTEPHTWSRWWRQGSLAAGVRPQRPTRARWQPQRTPELS